MKYIRTKDQKGKQYIINDRDYVFLISGKKGTYRAYKISKAPQNFQYIMGSEE